VPRFDHLGKRAEEGIERFGLFVAIDDEKLRAPRGGMQENGVEGTRRESEAGETKKPGTGGGSYVACERLEHSIAREARKQLFYLNIPQAGSAMITVAAFGRAEVNHLAVEDALERSVGGDIGAADGVLMEEGGRLSRSGSLRGSRLRGTGLGAPPQPEDELESRTDGGEEEEKKNQPFD